MKKYFKYLCMGLVGMLFLNSCDDDDDLRFSEVPQTVVGTFQAMFPNVNGVEWEKNRGWYVADFWYQNAVTEAWFDAKGAWSMTETDFGKRVTNLPEVVQTALSGSQYATWRVDDVYRYERPTDTFYLVEVEMHGQPERNLYYAPDGSLLKDEVDRDGHEVRPDYEF